MVSPVLFESLTGHPALVDVFDEPETGKMAHIEWAKWADTILIAPATANTINKIAWGVADNMLTTILLASDASVIVVPAMNPTMYNSKEVQSSIKTLSERGVIFVEPVAGEVACGDEGQGKLASNEEIVAITQVISNRNRLYNFGHIFITSGPTQEPFDSVRYMSNHSSGKMGAALAQAACQTDAKVTVVSGPTNVPFPQNANVVYVQTAEEMLHASIENAHDASVIIAAAAVADYKFAEIQEGKMRRAEDELTLKLTKNPDIIASLAREYRDAYKVAFAAEPSDDIEYAKQKLKKKGVQAIAMNDISRHDIGFGSDQNELTLITEVGDPVKSGKMSKLACAFWLLEQIKAKRA